MTHSRHARGPLVRVLREAHGMTLESLGRAAGLSAGYISRIERGERQATEDNTFALARALGLHPAYLTGQWPPVRALRLALNDQLAPDFADSVGLTQNELIEIELGLVTPDSAVLARISQRLGVPAAVLSAPPSPASTEQ